MKNKWIIVLVTILIVSVFISVGITFFINKKPSSTLQKFSTQLKKITEPFTKISSLNTKLSKVSGIKGVGLKIGFNGSSSGKTDYIAVTVSLKKGYHFKNVANELVRVIFNSYPDYKKKDIITIIERKELNLGFFQYSQDVNVASKSINEWEELLD